MNRADTDTEKGRRHEATPDGRVRMIGPFLAPFSHDWLFGLWLGLVLAQVWSASSQSGGDPRTATGTIAWLVIGTFLSALGNLALLGMTVGAWRGYRLGYLEGRRNKT